jgi:hypothetical protein
VAGEWEGAQTRVFVARQAWEGLGAGHGRLRGRRAQVVATGRGAAARPRARWLWLPGSDGSVSPAYQVSVADPALPDTKTGSRWARGSEPPPVRSARVWMGSNGWR